MSVSAPIRIHPEAPPQAPSWIDQLQDALALAQLDERNIETLIYLGEGGGLALLRKQAERRVNVLTAQLAEELARVGVRA